MSYEKFIKKLNDRIKLDEEFNFELLKNVVKNPHRYTGCFRLSNADTKLVQNVTQSREIKFGDFMEDIVTDYISLMGYTNINKSIGCDDDGNELSADQVFYSRDCGSIILIEQKIRDDHDSTKKRGQYANFEKKYTLLKHKYPKKRIIAIMWFIDETLTKNKRFYNEMANQEIEEGIEKYIIYGRTLFTEFFKRDDVWNEIEDYLWRNKEERDDKVITIPDFDSSYEMLQALRRLRDEEPKLYKKLTSEKQEYVQLRRELFPKGINFRRM